MEQRKPRLHNEVYPFIYPSKFKGSLKGEVAVVTGSTGTIGRAVAECFSTAGASLVLTYNRTPPSEAFRQTCLQLGAGAVTFIQCNVSNLESCRNLIEQTEQQFEKVDILINNAGVEGVGPSAASTVLAILGIDQPLAGLEESHRTILNREGSATRPHLASKAV
ncbi:11-beta-hydroxysteroid dehydrogenase-like 2 [Colletotrichum orbiculare MAFF 240422]|uniref:11-beta-hydroxysteroid dehydrogenase-like 2 n=1 Tax=Colletotrichum orbiculare (strain 104-T / ATCC 96160 / CBS 514.97 / LARS 414 / MAFF 240422) TaxID=1213857 RepID=A0A484F8A5_COLOR|nr:11-beta-hydroxysteroid dehydrogenase-like 2 [Colletotrichum orbiculare MAFF 240422]